MPPAPEAVVGVHEAPALVAVASRLGCVPAEPAHQISDDQRCRATDSRAAVHQDRCGTYATTTLHTL